MSFEAIGSVGSCRHGTVTSERLDRRSMLHLDAEPCGLAARDGGRAEQIGRSDPIPGHEHTGEVGDDRTGTTGEARTGARTVERDHAPLTDLADNLVIAPTGLQFVSERLEVSHVDAVAGLVVHGVHHMPVFGKVGTGRVNACVGGLVDTEYEARRGLRKPPQTQVEARRPDRDGRRSGSGE